MLILAHTDFYEPEQRPVKTLVGAFSQKQYAFKAVAVIEGTAAEADEPQTCIKQDFPNLFLDFPRGPQTLNYNRLCACMKDKDKLAIKNATGEVMYVIWSTEMNAMIPFVGASATSSPVAAQEDAEGNVDGEEDSNGGEVQPIQPTLL